MPQIAARNRLMSCQSPVTAPEDCPSMPAELHEQDSSIHTDRVGKDARVVIVGGGGTMGSSTALHLLRRGYTDVRILDKWPSPSADSAGNDLNKVSHRFKRGPAQLTRQIAGSDGTGVWGDLSVAAWDMWRNDPVFAPHSHENGKVSQSRVLEDRSDPREA